MEKQEDVKDARISNQYTNNGSQQFPVQVQPQSYNTTTNTVVLNQPQGRKWRYGLYDCCANYKICMCVYCLYLCYQSGLGSRMGEGACAGLSPCGLSSLRTKFRMIHGIEGTVLEDACVMIWCSGCATCQLGNEMAAENYPTNDCSPC
uniref:Uncharacterized protein n=1 Tax=Ciona savignyi TaxID=51511 RepID=H2YSP0_CIOSA